MACIVTFKGKKFFKDDFINFILDTMHLEKSDIESSEYLQKIKYNNTFNFDDPLGIRKDNNKPQTNEQKVNEKGRQEGLLTEPTAEQKTEPVSSLSETNKPKPDAIQEQSSLSKFKTEKLLPRQQGEAGKTGGESGRMGQGEQGETPSTKGKEEKVTPEAPGLSGIEQARERLRIAKENAEKIRNQNIKSGAFKDPFEETKIQAQADREILDAYVELAKEYIKSGIKTIEEFAKESGEKITDQIRKAWDIANEKIASGIKVALVNDAIKEVMEVKLDRRSVEQVRDDARKKVQSGDIVPEALVNEILSKSQYSPSADEVVALVEYKATIDGINSKLNKDLYEAIKTGDSEKERQVREMIDVNYQKIFDYDMMALKTAADQSQGFKMRKLMLNEKYNAVRAIENYKAVNKGEITPEIEQKFKDLEKEIKRLNESLLEKDIEKTNIQREYDEKLSQQALELEAAQRKASTTTKRKSVLSPEKEARLNELRNKIKGRFNDVSQILANIADKEFREYASLIFEETKGEFIEFSKRIISEAGKKLAPYIRKIYKDAGGTDEGIFEASKPEIKDGKLVIPEKLTRAITESLYDAANNDKEKVNIEDIVFAVKKIVEDAFPNETFTETQVRDAITKYGITKHPASDPVSEIIAKAKRVGRLLSSKELTEKGQLPFRSGFQREKPSQRERNLNKQVRELMKDIPLTPEQQAKNWATALERSKTAVKNRIEDLDNAIKEGKKIEKSNKPKATDDVLRDLEAKRDALQKRYDELFDTKLTEAERIERAIKSLEESTAKTKKNILSGKIDYPERTQLPETPELKAARERNKAAKKELDELRKEEGLALKREREQWKQRQREYIKKKDEQIKEMKKTGLPYKPKVKKGIAEPFDAESERLMLERQRKMDEWDTINEKNRIRNMTVPQKIADWAQQLFISLPKTLTLGLDFSGPFIQGAWVIGQKSWRKGFGKMFKFFASESNYEKWRANLKSSDEYYKYIKPAGLHLQESTAKFDAKNDFFQSAMVHWGMKNIPIIKQTIGKGYLGTERAFVGFSNYAKADHFMSWVNELKKLGYTDAEIQKISPGYAMVINNLYGRGGSSIRQVDQFIGATNFLLNAPRFVTSTINLTANPLFYYNVYKAGGKMALIKLAQQQVRIVGVVASMTFMYNQMANNLGWDSEIVTDPTSPDYLRIRVGDTFYDGFSKIASIARLYIQIITGIKTNVVSGKKTELNTGEFTSPTTNEHLATWLRGKLNPSAAQVWNAGSAHTDIMGHKTSVGTAARDLFTPLSLRSMYELYVKDGNTNLLNVPIILFGQGATVRSQTKEYTEEDINAIMEKMRDKAANRPSFYEKKEVELDKKLKDQNERAKFRKMKEMGVYREYEKLEEKIEDMK